ncbi:WYL domain-containing protein [Clostridium phoceensis]|uniref:helix-turn-helix transcriptional regulator n=1 Tax=Clostridium phoceensis TaxID=1650661 RepID=UPI002E7AA77A|nr:WYL domain-containing protein [Clostridium phoceensis]
MAKSENQKVKTLYVAKYFLENSDENHPVTAGDVVDYLKDECGIEAERRAIYRDIAALRDVFGMDIDGGQGGKYRLLSRQFEFDDLRLLAECVHAAKFISAWQAKDLVDTLGEFCSTYQAEQLQREVFLCDRVKTTQKGTMAIITKINQAMATRQDGKPHTPQKISFKYLKYTLQDGVTQVERRKGADYKVSPYKLLINEGNYYLLAFDDKAQDMRTYRIDRMKEVKVLPEPREGAEVFSKIDMETYTRRVFSMFGGERKRVSIRFINPLLDTAVERFGTSPDVFYRRDDEKHFIVTADVEISDQFFAWVCGFGKRARIIAPSEAISMIKDFVYNIKRLYDG